MAPKATGGPKYQDWLRGDFFFFVSQCFRHLQKRVWLGNPCFSKPGGIKLCGEYDPDNWVNKDVCDWVQNGPKKRGVLMWRLSSKTEVISICYPLFRFHRDRNFKVVCVSKSGDKAENFLKAARTYIDRVPFLNYLAPRDRSSGERDRINAFDIGGSTYDPKDPSFKSIGIDGQIAGSHGDLLVADDIEDKDNCNTIVQRDNLRRKADEFNAIPYPDSGEILDVGTFHNEDSIHKNLALASQGGKGVIEFRTWPICYPMPGMDFVGLAPKVTERMAEGKNTGGDILAPYQVTRSHVIAQQAVGARWYGLQYMLQANMRETNRYPLRLDDLIVFESGTLTAPLEIVWGKLGSEGSTVFDVQMNGWRGDKLHIPIRVSESKDWRPYQLNVMCVDPGGSGKSSTAWACGSSLNGRVFVRELRAEQRGAVNIPVMAESAFQNRCTRAYVEGNLGGAYDLESNSFAMELQKALSRYSRPVGDKDIPEGWGCQVEVTHSSAQKDIRITGQLETPMGRHMVIISPQVAQNQKLHFQISHITTMRGSLTEYDEIDVIGMLVGKLSPTFLIDADKAAVRSREQAFDEALAKRRGRRGTGSIITYYA